jgi:hypothetical protein
VPQEAPNGPLGFAAATSGVARPARRTRPAAWGRWDVQPSNQGRWSKREAGDQRGGACEEKGGARELAGGAARGALGHGRWRMRSASTRRVQPVHRRMGGGRRWTARRGEREGPRGGSRAMSAGEEARGPRGSGVLSSGECELRPRGRGDGLPRRALSLGGGSRGVTPRYGRGRLGCGRARCARRGRVRPGLTSLPWRPAPSCRPVPCLSPAGEGLDPVDDRPGRTAKRRRDPSTPAAGGLASLTDAAVRLGRRTFAVRSAALRATARGPSTALVVTSAHRPTVVRATVRASSAPLGLVGESPSSAPSARAPALAALAAIPACRSPPRPCRRLKPPKPDSRPILATPHRDCGLPVCGSAGRLRGRRLSRGYPPASPEPVGSLPLGRAVTAEELAPPLLAVAASSALA